jgi:hypothetical protein
MSGPHVSIYIFILCLIFYQDAEVYITKIIEIYKKYISLVYKCFGGKRGGFSPALDKVMYLLCVIVPYIIEFFRLAVNS